MMKQVIAVSFATFVFLSDSTLSAMSGTVAVAISAGQSSTNPNDTGGAGSSTGSGATVEQTNPIRSPEPCRSVTGVVVSKDVRKNVFTLHRKIGGDRIFRTDAKTSYWVGKAPATWTDLTKGDTVHVTCVRSGASEVARTVKIKMHVAAAHRPH